MLHFVVVGILVLIATALTYFGLEAAHLMPVAASAQAREIDGMWNLMLIAMSFFFALIVVPMAYSLVVFRRKKGDKTDAEHIEGNAKLEITWTVIPLFIVVAFSVLGGQNLANTIRPSQDAMVVKVTGTQWSWKFEYPEYGVTTTQLYLPVNRPVLLRMEATDVVHSFWVPEFRVKQDLVPGRVTELRFTPTRSGDYQVRCAELCGTKHYDMEADVIVVEGSAFTAWVAEEQAKLAALNTPEAKGQALVTLNGCNACHSFDGTARPTGPTWFNLFGSTVQLNDGTTVTADEAFITQSIKEPQATIVNGFPDPSPMPPYSTLTDEDIANIIAYIKTLK